MAVIAAPLAIASWITATVVTVALNIAAYVLTPKPKRAKPGAVQDAQYPTAEAGRPVPVLFGTVTIKGANVLWYGDKASRGYSVKV